MFIRSQVFTFICHVIRMTTNLKNERGFSTCILLFAYYMLAFYLCQGLPRVHYICVHIYIYIYIYIYILYILYICCSHLTQLTSDTLFLAYPSILTFLFFLYFPYPTCWYYALPLFSLFILSLIMVGWTHMVYVCIFTAFYCRLVG